MLTIQGIGVSAGICAGPLHFFRRATGEAIRYQANDPSAQWLRFTQAQEKAIEELGCLAEKAREELGDEAALLFETHQMMAEDLDYVEVIQGFIDGGLMRRPQWQTPESNLRRCSHPWTTHTCRPAPLM